ncbi:sulfatase-like hydrolase/transferase [Sphingopyxis sp. R3-92]|uniref:sulfatase-like hydrolase/transferase n=1 Tax=Sphingopyxis sp. R3-92 TaxID=3158553 RepID=UPI003EE7C731
MRDGTGIDRRTLLAAGAAALVATNGARAHSAPGAPAVARPRGKRPNILLIVNDQERALADIPEKLPLPAHEWLREKGMSFDRFHVNTTPCGPSRSNIYTGLHTQHSGIYANPNSPPHPQLSPQIPTIGTMLRGAGYRTTYKGKWHLSNINEGRNFRGVAAGIFPNTADILEPYGFSGYNFDGEREGLSWEGFKNDGVTAAEAVSQLRAFAGEDGDAPWFMAVNFVNPHDIMFYDPTGAGEGTRARPNLIAPLLAAPGDPIYDRDWGFPLPKSYYLDDLSRKPRAHEAITASSAAFYGRMRHEDEAVWLRNQNYYFNCIRDVDRHMKTVIDGLIASGQLDNTIILFTSDHGERAGAHRMRQKGGTIYKEDVGVPLVVVHPDLRGGTTTQALGSAVDLVPTMLSLAGITDAERRESHPALVGHDLSPALASPKARTARDKAGVFFNYAVRYGWNAPDVPAGVDEIKPLPENDLMLRRLHRGVHDGRYKFARYFAPAQHHIPTRWSDLVTYNDLELYDTVSDPDELNNLAWQPEAHKAVIQRLNEQTNALIASEIGVDNGAEYPGPASQYSTLRLT